jgi:hypothetical protein
MKKKRKSGANRVTSNSCISNRYTSSLKCHNNFLSLTGFLKSNLPASETIDVEIPLHYNHIEVFVITPTSAIKQAFPVPHSDETPKRDLRHTGLKESDAKKGLTMSR